MTKSKSSTIAIVVLSVLLAAALASTIVLAAFSTTKTRTTTITFANGVVLTLEADAVTGFQALTASSEDSVTIASDNTEFTDQVTFPVIKGKVSIQSTVSTALTFNFGTAGNTSASTVAWVETTAGSVYTGTDSTNGWKVVLTLVAGDTFNTTNGTITRTNMTVSDTTAPMYTSMVFSATGATYDALAGKVIEPTLTFNATTTAQN